MHDETGRNLPALSETADSRDPDSEAAFVARISRMLDRRDRWGWILILVHLGILIYAGWLSFCIPGLFAQLLGANPNPNFMNEVVLIGIVLGVKLGLLLHHSISGIMSSLLGFRTERLLVQYFQDLHRHHVSSESENAIDRTL